MHENQFMHENVLEKQMHEKIETKMIKKSQNYLKETNAQENWAVKLHTDNCC